jgi:hypothetical protein
MAEDWLEIIEDYNAAFLLEKGREHERGLRVQRVLIMKKR